jgi:hypothetical protein
VDGCAKQSKSFAYVQLFSMKSTLNFQTAFNKFTNFRKSCMSDAKNSVSNFMMPKNL